MMQYLLVLLIRAISSSDSAFLFPPLFQQLLGCMMQYLLVLLIRSISSSASAFLFPPLFQQLLGCMMQYLLLLSRASEDVDRASTEMPTTVKQARATTAIIVLDTWSCFR